MKRKIFELILMFVIFFPVTMTLAALLYSPDALDTAVNFDVGYFITYIVMTVPLIILLVYIIWLSRQPLSDFGFTPVNWGMAGWAAIGVAGAFSIAYYSGIVISMLPEAVREVIAPRVEPSITSPAAFAVSFLFCIVVGYKEELFFRSFMFTRLRELKVPLWPAIIVTSVVFGLLHSYNGPLAVVVTTLIGFGFQLIYIKTKNIHVVAVAHTLYNFLLFAITFFLKDFFEELQESVKGILF